MKLDFGLDFEYIVTFVRWWLNLATCAMNLCVKKEYIMCIWKVCKLFEKFALMYMLIMVMGWPSA